jgi:thioredoxin-related protein
MRLGVILSFFLLFSCQEEKSSDIWDSIFADVNSYIVLMFLAPDCPLCETLSYDYIKLQEKYPNISFYGIVSGKLYSQKEIKYFVHKNDFSLPILLDEKYQIAERLKPTHTPEFYLLDAQGKIIYRGLLDNRMQSLGVFRTITTEFYLDSAISQVHLQNKAPEVSKTNAIGCVFEY